jgi:hypothetical protein
VDDVVGEDCCCSEKGRGEKRGEDLHDDMLLIQTKQGG